MHIPANALLVVTVMGLTVAMDNGPAGERRLARQAIAAYGTSLTLEAFERSGQLGARDQIAVVNIQDIRRSVPVGR